ncbi:MAG: hypothetical protein ABIX19_10900 [Gemmatimonadaceae bacterium]
MALVVATARIAVAQARTHPGRSMSGEFEAVRRLLEAEGAVSLRDSTAVPGDTARRCVDVAVGPARSGEFSVRGFERYAASWYAGGAKLTWWPTHARASDTLMVRLVNARRREDSVSFRFGVAVRPGGENALMHPSAPRMPHPGPWYFVARAGPNWGCFLYVLPDVAPPRPLLR